MALTEVQQITKTIDRARHILITFPKKYSVDAVASALGLALFLKKQGKLVDIVADGFTLPAHLSFLPQAKEIKPTLFNLQKFIITVDNKNDRIEDFSYSLEDHKLKIFVTPKHGTFSPEDVTAESSSYKYDLIITLDAADLESLGEVYLSQTEFFYETTIINIDHQSDNEHFGQINLVNANAVATASILFRLINTVKVGLLDENIATCLLTGMIAETKSFKTPNVTPQTLSIASKLMELEADKEMIVRHLYRSRSVGTLNLWGRVLARLKSDLGSTLIWSVLSENDFVEAKASEEDLSDVIDELISFIPGVKIIMLIYQHNGSTKVTVHTTKAHNALYLASTFKPEGTKMSVTFSITSQTLRETEQAVIDEIKKKLEQNA